MEKLVTEPSVRVQAYLSAASNLYAHYSYLLANWWRKHHTHTPYHVRYTICVFSFNLTNTTHFYTH